jgi:hypothetical protein
MVAREVGTGEGVFWICLGVVICVIAWGFDLGNFREPGAGFIAFFCGLSVGGIGIIMVAARAAARNRSSGSTKGRVDLHVLTRPRLLYCLALLLAYIVLLNSLGYILVTLFLMWGMSYDWEQRNWFWSTLFSIITVAVSYLMFEVWLHIQLPRGVFPWW